MTAAEILKDLVAINTIRDKENKKIMDYIEPFLMPYGFKIDRRKNKENGNEVIVAEIGENPAMGFLGHTDTVDIAAGWETNPFELTEKDGMLYGLGACDMKGGIAASLWAVSQMDPEKLQKGIKLYYTYDEEIMFGGIRDLVDGEEKFPEHVIIAEPSDLAPMVGSKGLLEFIFTFKGVSTHSSAPLKGKNSNKNAVKFLNKMLALEDELAESRYDGFEYPSTSMNVGIIEGGKAMNTVPNETKVYLDFRICDSEKEYEKIRKYVDDAIAVFVAEYVIINDIPSFYNESETVKFYEQETGNERRTMCGISEASFFKGDRVIIGPGPETAHQANECISAESLQQTAELYVKAIEKLCY